MAIDRELDYYSVEMRGDEKVIHVCGFVWEHEEEGWVDEQLTFCLIPVGEYGKDRLDREQCAVTHYMYPLDDVDEPDQLGEHLPLSEVNEDTPCGDYWCYLEEE